MNQKFIKLILVVAVLIIGGLAGYIVLSKKQVKNLPSEQNKTQQYNKIESTAINMGTTAFGKWSYKNINVDYGIDFGLYLPEDSTVDTLTKSRRIIEIGEAIGGITVPTEEKFTSRKIDLVDDKWFQLGINFDVNLASMTLDEWIEFFAKQQGFSKKEITSEDMTMINENIKGKIVILQGISQPIWYVVNFNDHIVFFTGGQDPGTDTDLAKKVISTLRAN